MEPISLISVVTALCFSTAMCSVLPPGSSETDSSADQVLDAVQGSWTLNPKRSVMLADTAISEFLPDYRSALSSIQFDGRRLLLAGTKDTIQIDDLPVEEKSMPNDKEDPAVLLRRADGKTVTASFSVGKEGIFLTIPAHSCKRSGVWLRFNRLTEKEPLAAEDSGN